MSGSLAPDALSLEDCTAVILTRSSWDELPRMRQQLARQLSRFCHVVYAESLIDWRVSRKSSTQQVDANLHRYQLRGRRVPPRLLRLVPSLNAMVQRSIVHEVVREARRHGGRAIILVNFNADLGSEARQDDVDLSVYVCNDDFGAIEANAIERRAVNRLEADTASSADLCLAVSVPLADRLRSWNPKTELFLPGHEFAVVDEKPVASTAGGQIRVGFMGYINDRLLFDWLHLLARQPDIRLDLIGPVETRSASFDSLVQNPSVQVLAPLTGDSLQNALRQYDVLVMPYDFSNGVNGLSVATAPNKLFAYLAVGKPVVISAMPAFIDFGPGVIYRSDSAQSFVDTIRRSHAEDSDEFREKRARIARENSWSVRGEQLRTLLNRMLAPERTRTPELPTAVHAGRG